MSTIIRSGDRVITRETAKHWWTFVLSGVLALIFGIMAWSWPGLTGATLIWMAGFWLIFDGAFRMAGAVFNKSRMDSIWPVLLMGLAGIFAGVFILSYPGFTVVWLMVTIGIYAIVSGVSGVYHAIKLRKEIDNEWSLAFFGLVSVIFGLMMIAFPGKGALSLIWVIAIYAIIIGVTEIYFGFRMRGMAK